MTEENQSSLSHDSKREVRPDYSQYISSPDWKAKRIERLTIDRNLCVVCGQPAFSVHHLHYDSLEREDARMDLISVCEAHHHYFDEVERFTRYQRRERLQACVIAPPKGSRRNVEKGSVPIGVGLSNDHAQRSDVRSAK